MPGTTVGCVIPTSGPICTSFFLKQCTEIDSLEFSELATNFKAAQVFRATTLERINMYLALDCKVLDQDTDAVKSASQRSILEQFALVGCALVKHCELGKCLFPVNRLHGPFVDALVIEQRKALMQHIKFFVDMSELEQRVQLSGHLPSLESYQFRRMGTSAVAVCLAIHEYIPSFCPHDACSL